VPRLIRLETFKYQTFYYSKDAVTETVFLNENTVNKPSERTGPGDFELLKTLGKGGYGKVILLLITSVE